MDDRRLGCFNFVAIFSKEAISIRALFVCGYIFSYLVAKYLGMQLLGHMVRVCLTLWEITTCSPKYNFYSYQFYCTSSFCMSKSTLCIARLSKFIYARIILVLSCDLKIISLIIIMVEKNFMCLSYIMLFSFFKV